MSHTIRIYTIVMRPYQGGNFPVRLIQGWLRKISSLLRIIMNYVLDPN